MHKIIFISTLSLLFIACRPNIDEAKLAKIDSLQAVLDSNQLVIEQMDSTKAKDYPAHYFENIDYIKTKFNDTIETETAFFIDKYYSLRKAMKLIQKQYSTNIKELEITQQQIKNLKHDLNNGLIEKEKLNQYIELETKNVEEINTYIMEVEKAYREGFALYEEMNPAIDSLINEDKLDKQRAKQAKANS